jgi:hypothetical protein
MFTIDGNAKRILVSGVTEFNLLNLYKEVKEWEDNQTNMVFVSPMDAVGKESLKPDVFTDIVYILNHGWKLQPTGYASGVTVRVEGTLITDDNSSPTVPPTTGQPITWVMQVAYSGIITQVSTGSGLSGEQDQILRDTKNLVENLEVGGGGLTDEQDQIIRDTNIMVNA